MPEGDTIHRTARALREWLAGRVVTGARAPRGGVPAARLVGLTVVGVEARAKHLLVRLSSGEVLHTHMRMTGSWHVHRRGEPWRRPAPRARLVLEAGDRVAVCFDAPVLELLAPGEEARHPALSRLGPDVLVDPLDLGEVRRRAAGRPAGLAAGELLLDQAVVSGVGNVYRCEALFLAGVHPWRDRAALGPDGLDLLVGTAAALMRANLDPAAGFARRFGPPGGPAGPWVYGRAGRPCRRCGAPVRAGPLGLRTVWWCPRCQPPGRPPPAPGTVAKFASRG